MALGMIMQSSFVKRKIQIREDKRRSVVVGDTVCAGRDWKFSWTFFNGVFL